jgi:hypothetical protein
VVVAVDAAEGVVVVAFAHGALVTFNACAEAAVALGVAVVAPGGGSRKGAISAAAQRW